LPKAFVCGDGDVFGRARAFTRHVTTHESLGRGEISSALGGPARWLPRPLRLPAEEKHRGFCNLRTVSVSQTPEPNNSGL
jgi:hypothetical protein